MPTQHIVFTWDDGWFAPRAELNTWASLCKAYGVGWLWAFPVVRASCAAPPEFRQLATLDDVLANLPAGTEPVYVEASGGEDLAVFKHPPDAAYIFGNARAGNNPPAGATVVTIATPDPNVELWPFHAAAIVLHDRAAKGA